MFVPDHRMFNRRLLPLLALTMLIFVIYLFRSLSVRDSWRSFPLEKIGLGEEKIDPQVILGDDEAILTGHNSTIGSYTSDGKIEDQKSSWYNFVPGTVKPLGSTYTKTLIVPRIKEEDVSWISENFGPDSGLNLAIYVADDPSAPLHPPKNKGHEVMVYLTYIIDYYDNLADVNMFMHAHRWTWHNNDLLDNDAVQMISRLSAERVQRVGYMNMRCHWSPGCPDWMHPGTVEEDINKQEETMLAKTWSELFPHDPIPNVLAQPCCAQFAISRDRIRSIPRARYVFYRDWLLRTKLSDYISGRVWEYVWQYVFTGQEVVCPSEHVCYCDGYGVCFGGEGEYNAWWYKFKEKRDTEEMLNEWLTNDEAIRVAMASGDPEDTKTLPIPEFGKDEEYRQKIAELETWLQTEKQKAKERGDVAPNRAKEAGREWKLGDGF